MRKLMWFSIGFAIACALGVWVLSVAWIVPGAVCGALLTVLFSKLHLRRVTAVLIGCTVGLIWYLGFQHLTLNPARAMDAATLETTVTATDYSYDTDYGVAVDGEFHRDGKIWKIRIYVNDTQQIQPGDTVTGTFKLRYTAPGGMRDPTYHAGKGVLLLGYERGNGRILRAEETEFRYAASNLRREICLLLERCIPEDMVPFAKALLLGESYDLDYETDTALKLSGIRHIIAVSGLHVAILFTMLRVISLNRRFITALIGYPVLGLFCAVAGFTPSVTRACIMIGLMLLAQLLDREYDSPTALAFAALVMLAHNPLVISSISFQMSVACVAGILLFQESISKWMYAKLGVPEGKSLKARLKRWFVSSVSVSLSAIALTTPMSAWYFGTVSLVGVLTNLMTLWAVSLAFYGLIAVCLLGIFTVKGAALLGFPAALLMRYVVSVAKLLASFPLAAVYTKSVYIVLWLIFVYMLLAVFLLSGNRRPMVLMCCAVLGLCLSLLVSWTEHTFSNVHFTALDVGQGQSLILHCDGKTFLIDCGGSNDEQAADTAAETLLSRGITRVDGIILTHGDRDHAGGIPYLLTRIEAGFLMLPATTPPETVANLTGDWSGEVISVENNLLLQFGAGEMTVFGPIFAAESNENSLCVLFERENCAILVTGDRGFLGETVLLRESALTDVDLLIAGHHGSKNATSAELLEAVRPETVFISVGENNAYGHPARELLDRLTAFGCEIFRTDRNGTIIFRR